MNVILTLFPDWLTLYRENVIVNLVQCNFRYSSCIVSQMWYRYSVDSISFMPYAYSNHTELMNHENIKDNIQHTWLFNRVKLSYNHTVQAISFSNIRTSFNIDLYVSYQAFALQATATELFIFYFVWNEGKLLSTRSCTLYELKTVYL